MESSASWAAASAAAGVPAAVEVRAGSSTMIGAGEVPAAGCGAFTRANPIAAAARTVQTAATADHKGTPGVSDEAFAFWGVPE